jgi:hypothetical protein
MAGLVDKRMTCTECGNTVLNEQSFCEKCGTALDWSEYVEPIQERGMRCGTINCSCGQLFYFETAQTKIHCIKCGKEHDVSAFPFKEDIVEVPAEEAEYEEVE